MDDSEAKSNRASRRRDRARGRRPGALAALTLALAVALAAALSPSAGAGNGGTGHSGTGPGPAADPYRGDGMWIWYVSRSSGGHLGRIAHKAHRHGIETVYVKSSDGGSAWTQFTHGLVSALHARGLRVCAWQFVYGTHPRAEARRGAEAVAKGADCLVIDAESTYEGRYRAADVYVDKLRHRIGRRFPTALASFPYVDYHPALPYSVFLGPGGARFDLPQLYWHAIGDTVGVAYAHTFQFNRVYGRPIRPLGQTYGKPPIKQVQRFRRMALSYGLGGVSWWDWQETTKREWRALGRPITRGVPRSRTRRGFPALAKGSRGDLVVWAQEHLSGAGQRVPVTGFFGSRTKRSTRRFQRDHGLAVDGRIRTATWRALLHVKPKMVDWSRRRGHRGSKVAGAAAPRSAELPARRDEIPAPRTRR